MKLSLKALIPIFIVIILLLFSFYYLFVRHFCFSTEAGFLCKAANNRDNAGGIELEIINNLKRNVTLTSVYSHACKPSNWGATPYVHWFEGLEEFLAKYEGQNHPVPLYPGGDFFISVSCQKRVFFDRIDFEYNYENESETKRASFYILFDYYRWPTRFFSCCE